MDNTPTTSAWDEVDAVETSMIKFEEVGKTVVGLLTSRKETETKFGLSPLYRITTAEGDASFFSSPILDERLFNQIGKIVRIKFTETTPSTKGADTKLFEVKAIDDTPDNREKVGLGEVF